MKKLLTLFALMACFLGVKADEVVDVEIDYTTVTSDSWNGGWRSDAAAERVSVVPGEGIYFHSEEATDPYYDVQFQLPGVPASSLSDAAYTITIKICLSCIPVGCTKVGHVTIVKLRHITHYIEREASVSGVVDGIDLLPLTSLCICSQETCQESKKSKNFLHNNNTLD